MQKPLIECPSCHGELHISALCCPDCGMELKNSFELSIFDKLSPELDSFLLSFLSPPPVMGGTANHKGGWPLKLVTFVFVCKQAVLPWHKRQNLL